MSRAALVTYLEAASCAGLVDPATRARLLQVVAVVGGDPTPAIVASALARAHSARLSVIQVWSPPLVLWGLGPYPGTLQTGDSRETLISQQARSAEARLRTLVQKLDHAGPVARRCVRGRVEAVALEAARSAGPDCVVIADRSVARRWRCSPRRGGRKPAVCKVRVPAIISAEPTREGRS